MYTHMLPACSDQEPDEEVRVLCTSYAHPCMSTCRGTFTAMCISMWAYVCRSYTSQTSHSIDSIHVVHHAVLYQWCTVLCCPGLLRVGRRGFADGKARDLGGRNNSLGLVSLHCLELYWNSFSEFVPIKVFVEQIHTSTNRAPTIGKKHRLKFKAKNTYKFPTNKSKSPYEE